MNKRDTDWLVWRFRQDGFPVDTFINGGYGEQGMWQVAQEMFTHILKQGHSYPAAYDKVKAAWSSVVEAEMLRRKQDSLGLS